MFSLFFIQKYQYLDMILNSTCNFVVGPFLDCQCKRGDILILSLCENSTPMTI